jgi:MFS family permease
VPVAPRDVVNGAVMSTAATSFWPTSINRSARRGLIASWMGWMFDGYENFAIVLVMTPAVHQLLQLDRLSNASIYAGGLLAATMVGWAVGGVAAGVMADYLGRRRTLMLSILCYAVFAGLTAVSWDYWSLLTFRFFTGIGLGAEWGPGAAIVAELWPASSRGRAGGVLHAAQGAGLLLASGVWAFLNPLGSSAWRLMFVVGILPAFFLLYVRRHLDEPALWLAANEDRRRAWKRLAAGGDSFEDRAVTQFTLAHVFSNPTLRRRVSLLLLMSIATVVGFWSASTWIPEYAEQVSAHTPSQSPLTSSTAALIFSTGSIAGFLLLGVLADFLGRKPTMWMYYLGALLVSLCLFLFAHDRSTLILLVAASGLLTAGQFAWMTIYLPELFPTRVRGTAMSLVFDSSRSLAAVGPLLAGWMISSVGSIGAAAAAMSLIYVIGLIISPFAGPETKGKPLPA